MTRYWEDVLSGNVSAASDVHISEDFQAPIVYFASAVNNKEGRAIGVVVARILTSRLFEMVKASARIQEEEEEEEEIDLINKDGLLIYSNHNREGILKENLPEWESIKIAQREKIFGSVKYRNPDEKEAEIHAFCREQGHLDFKGNGWTIIFNVPTRVIFGQVNKVLSILIIMFMVMLPILALVIYLFSKTVTRPLTQLSFAAAEIGKGKLDTVIEVKSKDEIGSLANTFNEMAADLKKTTTSIDNLNKDITERKRAEEALQERNAELEKVLSEIRTLRGIIPICSSCKKIRDDKGYWHQVEVYISDHTEADFSHGICEECARKLYPGIYKDRG
jgi:methyl-accepting chemotaxis protein